MTPELQSVLGVAASALAVAATIPYVIGIHRGTNKPHLFAWIIWALLTVIAFAAQMAGGGGAGAWNTGVASAMCCVILAMTWRRVEFQATRFDWWMFGVGMASIPLWAMTANPLWAIIIVTGVEAIAFALTFKKAWFTPHEEMAVLYVLNFVRHIVALTALTQFNVITALFPSVMMLLNMIVISMLLIRRRLYAQGAV